MGCFFGRLLGPMHRQATLQLRQNMMCLRPDLTPLQIDVMVKQSWGNYGRVMAEFSVLQRIWKSNRTTVEGLHHFTDAKSSGRPVICLFLHVGNWEVIGPKLYALLGGDWIQIYQQLDCPIQAKIAERVRRPYAHSLITSGPFVGKKIVNKLKEGYTLNIAVDECVKDEVNTPSFGRPLSRHGNLNLALRLAKLTGATLCPVYATRPKGARFVLHVLPSIDPEIMTSKGLDPFEVIDKMIGSVIGQHLEAWYYARALNLNKDEL